MGTMAEVYYKHLNSGVVHIVREPPGSHVVTLCIWEENAWLAGEPCAEVSPPPTCLHCVVQARGLET